MATGYGPVQGILISTCVQLGMVDCNSVLLSYSKNMYPVCLFALFSGALGTNMWESKQKWTATKQKLNPHFGFQWIYICIVESIPDCNIE